MMLIGSNLLKTVLLFVILITFTFCKKKNDKLIVSGVAINQQTQAGIGGMNVTLSAKTISSGTWNAQFTTIQSQVTSDDGSFSFSFDNMRASEYKITFSKPGYFLDEYIFLQDLLTPGIDFHQNYYVHFEAWLKLNIKNFPPTSNNDILSYRLIKGSVNCPNGCSDSLKYLYGANIDTYHICKLYGSQNAVLEWNNSNYLNNQQHIDTIWIQSGDTTVYNIGY